MGDSDAVKREWLHPFEVELLKSIDFFCPRWKTSLGVLVHVGEDVLVFRRAEPSTPGPQEVKGVRKRAALELIEFAAEMMATP